MATTAQPTAPAPEGVTAAPVDPKLTTLRKFMAEADGGVDAFIIPSEDPHMVSKQRIRFLSLSIASDE